MTISLRSLPVVRLLGQTLFVLTLWFVATVLLTVTFEPTRFAVVVGPLDRSIAALAGSDTRIADAGRVTLVVQGNDPGFVRALYANGAWLVLPRRSGGCLSFDRRS